jgi:hypothetical protein
MVGQGVLHVILDGYILGSSFCRQSVQRGGVCNCIKKDKRFNKIGTLRHCKEQDLEICAFQLRTETCNLIMLSLYRYFSLFTCKTENFFKFYITKTFYKSCPTICRAGANGGMRYSSYSFLTLALDGGELSASCPDHALLPEERNHCNHFIGGWVVFRARLATKARGKILCLCRGLNSGCPVCSQTLY